MVTYESYIHPHLLPPVEPLEAGKDDPDEQFFIRTHQTFEIWFAQLLAELEFARTKLSAYVAENDVPLITLHVRRAAAIFDLLRGHLPLLESLLTTSFFDFRRQLFGAGGIQSYRFRELEWLIGFRDPDLLKYVGDRYRLERRLTGRNSAGQSQVEQEYRSVQEYNRRATTKSDSPPSGLDASHDALARREQDLKEQGSLRSRALQWLAGTPFPAAGGTGIPRVQNRRTFVQRFRGVFDSVYQDDLRMLAHRDLIAADEMDRSKGSALAKLDWFLRKPERCAVLFILQFAEQPLLAWPASLLEALLELDQAYQIWRDRHIAMVARVLGGGRISTTGAPSSGLSYLQSTLAKRAFPEIWDARTFLLGRNEAAPVYCGGPEDWGEWRHYRLAFEVDGSQRRKSRDSRGQKPPPPRAGED